MVIASEGLLQVLNGAHGYSLPSGGELTELR